MALCVADYNCVDLNNHVRYLNPLYITCDLSELARTTEYIGNLSICLSLSPPNMMGTCVTKTVVCGTSHKYTNIHSFYSVKFYNH